MNKGRKEEEERQKGKRKRKNGRKEGRKDRMNEKERKQEGERDGGYLPRHSTGQWIAIGQCGTWVVPFHIESGMPPSHGT